MQTGGTIDKDYPRMLKGYAFEIGDAAVKRVLRRVHMNFVALYRSACRKDSTQITDSDRASILRLCETSSTPYIVITHGTDTMIQTARYLERKLRSLKSSQQQSYCIVLTGAMKPEKFSDTDAHFNVGFAVAAAQCAKPGVYVAMNGRLLSAHVCERDTKTGLFVTSSPHSKL